MNQHRALAACSAIFTDVFELQLPLDKIRQALPMATRGGDEEEKDMAARGWVTTHDEVCLPVRCTISCTLVEQRGGACGDICL